MKKFILKWLGISPCDHEWERIDEVTKDIKYQLPPKQVGSFFLPSLDDTVYVKKEKHILLKCTKCGDMKTVVL